MKKAATRMRRYVVCFCSSGGADRDRTDDLLSAIQAFVWRHLRTPPDCRFYRVWTRLDSSGGSELDSELDTLKSGAAAQVVCVVAQQNIPRSESGRVRSCDPKLRRRLEVDLMKYAF